MLPELAEVISTPKIALIPFSDLFLTQNYVNWLNNPTLMQFSQQRLRQHTIESCQTYMNDMRSQGHFFWAVQDEDRRHIGNITAYLDRVNQSANLAIMIGEPSAQGKGLGLLAWEQAIDHLFAIGIRKVHAGTLAPNKPMLRIFEKSGMEIEGVLKNHTLLNGQPTDIILAAKYHPKASQSEK